MFGIDWETIGPLYVQAFGQTLYMVSVAMLAGGAAGLVLGMLLYTTRRGGLLQNGFVYSVLNFGVNLIRPIPFILLLAFIGPLTLQVVGTQIGTEAVIFPLSIATAFAVSRIVEQNLVTIEPGVIEAARAMGASPLRIIFTLLVPEALGPLILGYTFMFIAVVDASAVAGIIGGGGLGDLAIVYGYQRFNYPVTLLAVFTIIVIVQLVQVLGNTLARRALRR
jgi:D-methionine transport system permease protein